MANHNQTIDTLESLARCLQDGTVTARSLVERCVANIKQGEGKKAFLSLHEKEALKVADSIDMKRQSKQQVPPYAGIPISIKDLFDIKGEETKAGSTFMNKGNPAKEDATVVARLRQAGFILMGRTNMTEFAYSGLGLNPHHGTPASPFDRKNNRISGGSSSGAAVSVSDGMAFGGIGTDTGGSCRIPAVLCGIVGYKPTQSRIPSKGCFPLSFSLDSIGSMAHSVRCVEILDAIMAGQDIPPKTHTPLHAIKLLAPTNYVLENMDDKVAEDYKTTLSTLRQAGVDIVEQDIPVFNTMAHFGNKGGFLAAEAFYTQKSYIEKHHDEYDPRVVIRMQKGDTQTALDYVHLLRCREQYIADMKNILLGYNGLIMPTVPIIPPKMSDLESEEGFHETNLLMIRNSQAINLLDGCAIALPMHQKGTAPTGITLASTAHHDAKIFALSHTVSELLS